MIVNRLSAVKHPEPTGLSRSGSARVAEAGIKFPECPADPRSSLLRPPVASGKPRELRVGAHDVVVGTTVRLVGGRHPQPPRENTKARCTDWGDGNREREVAWSLDGNPHSLRPFAFSSGIELKRDMGALGKSQRDVLPPEPRSEEHTSELQSRLHLVCRLLLEKKKPRSRRHLRPQLDAAHERRGTALAGRRALAPRPPHRPAGPPAPAGARPPRGRRRPALLGP